MSKQRPTSLADLTGDPRHRAITQGAMKVGQVTFATAGVFIGRVKPRWLPAILWRARFIRQRFPVRNLPIVTGEHTAEIGRVTGDNTIEVSFGGSDDD